MSIRSLILRTAPLTLGIGMIVLLVGVTQVHAALDTGWSCPDTFTEYATLNECRGDCVSNCKAFDHIPAPRPPNTTNQPIGAGCLYPTDCTSGYCDGSTGKCKAKPSTSASPVVTITQRPSSSNGINVSYLKRYADSIIVIINSLLVPVLMAIAFIYFLFGIYKYFILGATSETDRAKGRDVVLWSIVGFVVIFSIWGLVAVVGSTFGLSPGGGPPPYPLL